MAHFCRRSSFPQKTQSGRFIADIFFTDDFEGYRKSQIDIESLISDAHGAPAQLDRFAILVQHHLIVLKLPDVPPQSVLCPGACLACEAALSLSAGVK